MGKAFQDVPTSKIHWTHFKRASMTTQEFEFARLVVFHDGKKKKVLKDRMDSLWKKPRLPRKLKKKLKKQFNPSTFEGLKFDLSLADVDKAVRTYSQPGRVILYNGSPNYPQSSVQLIGIDCPSQLRSFTVCDEGERTRCLCKRIKDCRKFIRFQNALRASRTN